MEKRKINNIEIKESDNVVVNKIINKSWSKKTKLSLALTLTLGIPTASGMAYWGVEYGQIKNKVLFLEDLNKDVLITQYNEIKMYIGLIEAGVNNKTIINMLKQRLADIKIKLEKLGVSING